MTAQLAWLIDTNVVSEMMRPRPELRVAAFLDSIEREGVGLASVTVWEILDGIGRLSPKAGVRENLATRFHDLLDELFEDRIVDWSLADARACAQIMEDKPPPRRTARRSRPGCLSGGLRRFARTRRP